MLSLQESCIYIYIYTNHVFINTEKGNEKGNFHYLFKLNLFTTFVVEFYFKIVYIDML